MCDAYTVHNKHMCIQPYFEKKKKQKKDSRFCIIRDANKDAKQMWKWKKELEIIQGEKSMKYKENYSDI